MDDIELGDGSSNRPVPPTEWERRRLAAFEAVDEARFTRLGLIRRPAAVERRLATELYRSIAA
ncbi:hypothetical protein ACFYWU_34285 [Streptomyces chrestomyceticus]|uniref:hypothetical protein n=1 Tax=Streptomyces chrestomyceticus TaxID=68185 RepID=UPI0036B975DF